MSLQELLNSVELTEIPKEKRMVTFMGNKQVAVATHEGILKIESFDFKVLQLEDGTRVIEQECIQSFLEKLREVLSVASKLRPS